MSAARLADGTLVLLGSSMAEVRTSVRRLVLIDLAVGLALLAVLATVSLGSARWRLRPLEDMAAGAAAISAGDLSRRIGPAGPRGGTEVEQLRSALNTMLQRLERVNEQLRQFVADASHELRTPLASLRGYLQLHERGMLGADEERRAFERIAAESARMGHLVDELLVLARLGRRPAARLAAVDLARLARGGAWDLRAQQPERPVSVETEPVALQGDEAMLRQLVGNLLSNVRVHTPPDSAVSVSVTGAGDQAVLRVSDSGPGTAIVRAVVEAHGGTVELDTAPGAGTTVTVRLPARAAAPLTGA